LMFLVWKLSWCYLCLMLLLISVLSNSGSPEIFDFLFENWVGIRLNVVIHFQFCRTVVRTNFWFFGLKIELELWLTLLLISMLSSAVRAKFLIFWFENWAGVMVNVVIDFSFVNFGTRQTAVCSVLQCHYCRYFTIFLY
jgi:hypothetical protein